MMLSNLILVTCGLVGVIIFIDFLQKRFHITPEWTRKITHTTIGLLALLLPVFLSPFSIVVLSVIFIILLAISKWINMLSLHRVERTTWGEIIFPVSIGAIAMIALPLNVKAYNVAVLCLALSDTTANIMGRILPLKQISYGNQSKSLGGFLGFFLVTFLIFSITYSLPGNYLSIFIVAITLSICEVLSFYGFDNLVVPILAAVFAMYLF